MRAIVMSTVLLAAACDATSGPAELDRARVLAVQVSPPHLGPDQIAPLEVLVGTADGQVAVVAPAAVAVTGLEPGSPADGMIDRGDDGWAIACPDASTLGRLRAELGLAEDDPIPIPLEVEVEVDGEILTATKLVYLGSQGDNPSLAGIAIDAGVEEQGVAVAASGDLIAIAADGAAGAGELSYAWYTAVGTIDLYLSEEAVLTAEGPAEGPLVLVVRDDRGGVVWSWRTVRVE